MKDTIQLLKILAVAVILVLVASTALAADTKTLPNIQAPKTFTPVQSQIKKYQPTPPTAGEIIQCPEIKQGKLTYMVHSSSVPTGWNAPDYSVGVNYVFNSASVMPNTLFCSYLVPVGEATIIKPWPAGKTCKAIDGKYFICE